VVLVLDRSAAWDKGGADLFRTAQRAAHTFVSALDGRHRLSLLLLHSKCVWVPREPGLTAERDDCLKRLDTVFAEGSPALFDGIAAACDRLRAPADAGPAAVVLLTSALEDRSRLAAADLGPKLRPRTAGRAVKLFAVVVGPRADAAGGQEVARALADLAALSGGRLRSADPAGAAAVLREVAAGLGRQP
jgi:hypothetical protein